MNVKYSYGTAGFRYHHKIIEEELAHSIGEFLGLLNRHLNMSFGIMITASHNSIEDNGVKIISDNGEMIDENIEKLITEYCNGTIMIKKNIINMIKETSVANLHNNSKKNGITLERPRISIGMDNRPSSLKIMEKIEDGLLFSFPFIEVDTLGCSSTPLVHYHMVHPNQYFMNIPFYFKKWIYDRRYDNVLLIDCANGIGGSVFSHIYNIISDNLICYIRNGGNTSEEISMLNNKCGSEYVQKEREIPISFDKDKDHSQRIAHFDGDADRLVYTMIEKDTGKVHLLDGDKIGVLITLFIQKELEILTDFGKTRMGFIQTAYANGASTEYVKNVLRVDTKYSATGVKNLHHIAKNYDIGVYFESNGHGTVLFSELWLRRLDDYYSKLCENIDLNNNEYMIKISAINNLYNLSRLINQYTGDAITNLLTVEGILFKSGITTEEWINMYDEKPNLLWKVKVNNKSVFKPCDDETRLLEPIEFQNKIDEIINNYNSRSFNVRCFVRPSGTENCVRIYCESDNSYILNEIKSKINRLFDEL